MAEVKGRTFTSSEMMKSSFYYFQEMWIKKEFCDVTFCVGDESVSAHSIIIAAVIPYFRGILASKDAERGREGISMPDIKPSAFKCLIEFAYSHEVKIDEKNVQDLLAAACHLDIKEVREECCDYLGDTLRQENAMDIHELALNLNCSELLEITDCYFVEHFGQVSQTKYFLNWPSTYLKLLIRKDELNVDNEMMVLESTLNWMKYSPDDRSIELPELLRAVRMPLIEPLELTKILQSEELVRKSTLCRDLLDEARHYNLFPQMRTSASSFSTKPRQSIKTRSIIRDNGRECIYKLHHRLEFIMQKFDLKERTWSTKESKTFYENTGCTAEMNNNMYYFIGNDTLHYDPENNVYTFLNETPTPRCYPGASALRNKIYVCGGSVGETAVNTVECFEPETDVWSKVRGMRTCRWGSSSVTLGEYIFVLGGRDGTSVHDCVERYDPRTDKWRNMASMLTKRSSAGAVPVNGKIYVCGGDIFLKGPECSATAEVYDPIKNTWNFISSMNTPPRGFVLLSCNGKIYALGGFDDKGKRVHAFDIYDPEKDEWISGPSTDTADHPTSAAVLMSAANL